MHDSLYIVWNEQNNLGINIIDEQHRSIVSTINTFHYFVKKEIGDEAVNSVLKILEQYTYLHFKTEEALILEANYPEFQEHFELHKTLIKKTQEIARDVSINKDTDEILHFLKKWWLNHINIEDRKYAPFVKKL